MVGLVACGPSPVASGDGATTDADATAQSDVIGSTDSGATDSGSTDAAASDAGNALDAASDAGTGPAAVQYPDRGGVVLLRKNGIAPLFWNAYADYTRTAGATCTRRTEGACYVQRCVSDFSDGGPPGPDGGSLPNAGTITVTGGAVNVTMMPTGMYGVYEGGVLPSGVEFHAGDLVSVSATGGDFPAFSGSLTYPELPVMTAPSAGDPDAGTPYPTIVRINGFTVQWTPTTGIASVIVTQLDSSSATEFTRTTIGCVFPAQDGTGTVPASVLVDLAPGRVNSSASTQFMVAGQASSATSAGNIPVILLGDFRPERSLSANVQ